MTSAALTQSGGRHRYMSMIRKSAPIRQASNSTIQMAAAQAYGT